MRVFGAEAGTGLGAESIDVHLSALPRPLGRSASAWASWASPGFACSGRPRLAEGDWGFGWRRGLCCWPIGWLETSLGSLRGWAARFPMFGSFALEGTWTGYWPESWFGGRRAGANRPGLTRVVGRGGSRWIALRARELLDRGGFRESFGGSKRTSRGLIAGDIMRYRGP
jgi:hypothetical protein